MTKEQFIKKIASYVKKYAPKYGIKVVSPIIAQAILESGWGKSTLASKYHNYFGLKCGTLWTGKSVNLTTNEEYTPGVLTTIKDNFRVYDNMEDGVKGYFEFIQLARYKNLRGITDPQTYLETISADGYATASDYVSSNMEIIKEYDLTQYDTLHDTQEATEMTKQQAIAKVTKIAEGEIGYLEKRTESDLDSKTANAGSNNYTKYWRDMAKLGLGNYQGGYWCAAFIAWIFYMAFGLKTMQKLLLQKFFINCQTMANLAAANGQLYSTPQVGDIVLYYNGREYYHTGYVIEVKSGIMTTIEGNTSGGSSVIANGGGVAKKQYRIASLNAKFFRPLYDTVSTENTSTKTDLSKVSQYVGKVTASELNVRTWAGTENAKIKAYPKLAKGNLVDVCDTVKAADGSDWYYIRIAGRYYGFVSARYIKRV